MAPQDKTANTNMPPMGRDFESTLELESANRLAPNTIVDDTATHWPKHPLGAHSPQANGPVAGFGGERRETLVLV